MCALIRNTNYLFALGLRLYVILSPQLLLAVHPVRLNALILQALLFTVIE